MSKDTIVRVIGMSISYTMINSVFTYELFSKEFWFVTIAVIVAAISGSIAEAVKKEK